MKNNAKKAKLMSIVLIAMMCLVAYFSTVLSDITNEKVISENETKNLQLYSPIEDVDLTKEEVPEGLLIDEWDDIQADLQKTRYYPTWSQAAEGYVASNLENQWGVTFDDGAAKVSLTSGEDWSWILTPSGYGYRGNIVPMNDDPEVVVNENSNECSPKLKHWGIHSG